MIALFARSNHPHGYGYSHPSFAETQKNGGLGAHGYVVIGVRCRTQKQVEKVVVYIRDNGLDLPDGVRQIYAYGKPEHPYEGSIQAGKTIRWYSGGPGDWDYLFTIKGNEVIWPYPTIYPSRGDNRYTTVYDAKDVLG